MNTIWVTGSKGQLGIEIGKLVSSFPTTRFIMTDIEELDLTDKASVKAFVIEQKPDIIINCAAYTAVDKAEEDQDRAFLLNRDIPVFLVESSQLANARLIHVSTDYVFDGTNYVPYCEEDNTNPQSVYGTTKLAGEKEVLKYPDNLVVRTSWLYSANGHNFPKTLLRLGKEREVLNVVFDQVGSPTSAADLADALVKMTIQILEDNSIPGGIFHYSNEGVCSWYDFALTIKELANLPCEIYPIRTAQYPLPAKRPPYSVMDKAKIKKQFGITVPHWKISLIKVLKELSAD